MASIVVAFSSGPFQNAPASLESSASLMVPPSTEARAPGRLGGIFAVDGHAVAKESSGLVYLQPGAHEIQLICPRRTLIDGYPETSSNFSPGKPYKLGC